MHGQHDREDKHESWITGAAESEGHDAKVQQGQKVYALIPYLESLKGNK
jgi:hypothetical protein